MFQIIAKLELASCLQCVLPIGFVFFIGMVLLNGDVVFCHRMVGCSDI
jgi:hypothetical protein